MRLICCWLTLYIYLFTYINSLQNEQSEWDNWWIKLKHSLSATHLINLFQKKATKYYGGHLFQIFRDSPQNKT
jgi:tRNA U38,U39,U40 pseudouridine synthase TruA